MEIRISIHTTEPVSGTATLGSETPLHFEGWLELLRALAALIGSLGSSAGEEQAASQHRPPKEG